MKGFFKRWSKRREQVSPQEFYYQQVENQQVSADQALIFMTEARRRGYRMKLHIEVDGVFCPSGEILLSRNNGKALVEYLVNWLAGVSLTYSEELLEMRRLWPDVAAGDGSPETAATDGRGRGVSGIAPEGP